VFDNAMYVAFAKVVFNLKCIKYIYFRFFLFLTLSHQIHEKISIYYQFDILIV
jgi:hypothetical protein